MIWDSTDTSYHRPLCASSSIVPSITLNYKDFGRTKHRKHDACLIHFIHILWQNVCSAEFLLDYIEPMYHLVIYAIIMTLPQHRPVVPRFNLWVVATEGLTLILLRWHGGSFRGASAGDAKSKRGDILYNSTVRDSPTSHFTKTSTKFNMRYLY
jgi:hypothetical protein